jgi:hypothetical protein
MQLDGHADLFCPFIWSCVSGLMQFCDTSDKGTAMMQPSCPELSLVTRSEVTVMTMGQSNSPPNGKVQTHRGQTRQDM